MINEEINNNLMELQTLIMKAHTMTKKLGQAADEILGG